MKIKQQIDKAKETQKVRMLSSSNVGSAYRPVNDKLVDNVAAARLKRLNIFFKECAEIIAKNPVCINCGETISVNDYRNSTGHILPKEIFRSVETHPLIWLPVGGRCGCHHDTHRLDKFSKMNCFKQAVYQFRQFEHLITEKHKLLDEFRKYAEIIIV